MAHSDSLDLKNLPEAIGAYRLEAVLEANATGQTFLATHPSPSAPTQIRILARSLVESAEYIEHIVNETRATNDLRHPNIIDLIEVIDDGEPRQIAFVSPFIDGPALKHLVANAWSVDEVLLLTLQLASALAASHKIGVVHGNLSPAALFIAKSAEQNDDSRRHLLVTNFGFARVVGRPTANVGEVFGNVSYLAPEQLERNEVTTAVDVYAIGEILFELLSRQPLFGVGLNEKSDRTAANRPSGDAPPIPACRADRAVRCQGPVGATDTR